MVHLLSAHSVFQVSCVGRKPVKVRAYANIGLLCKFVMPLLQKQGFILLDLSVREVNRIKRKK